MQDSNKGKQQGGNGSDLETRWKLALVEIAEQLRRLNLVKGIEVSALLNRRLGSLKRIEAGLKRFLMNGKNGKGN